MHVPREPYESRAKRSLLSAGKGVVVSGAPGGGKTTFLAAVMAHLREQQLPSLQISLTPLEEAEMDAPTDGLCAIINLFASAYRRSPQSRTQPVEPALGTLWANSTHTGERKFIRSFEDIFFDLDYFQQRVLLVIDRFDVVVNKKLGIALARQLRVLLETFPDRLLLMLGACGTNLHFTDHDEISALAGICEPIELPYFTLKELGQLAELLIVHWSDEQLQQLHVLLGGHPALSCRVMERSQYEPPGSLLDDLSRGLLLETEIQSIFLLVAHHPALHDVMCRFLRRGAKSLTPHDENRLRTSGLFIKRSAGLEMSGTALKAHFTKHC